MLYIGVCYIYLYRLIVILILMKYAVKGEQNMSKRNKIIVGILLIVSILVAGNEIYQFVRGLTAEYPDNDINGYIAWAAGGATDTTSRGISVQAQKFLGTNIVMQNKTGATGAIATEFVGRLPADGYSLLFNAENPTLYHVMDISNVDYEEFYPVLLFGSQVPVVIVPPNSKYQSIKEVIEDAAANPGKISLGISGVGGLPYNVSCMLQSTSNVQFNQVPFDGDSSIISALLGGHVDLSIVNYSTAADLYKTGDLRILTVLNNERMESIPEVETISEVYPEYEKYFPWGAFTGVYCRKEVADDRKEILTKAFLDGYNTEEFQKYLKDNYIIPLGISGDEAVTFIKRWQSVTTWLLYDSGATNISPENFGIPRIEDFE